MFQILLFAMAKTALAVILAVLTIVLFDKILYRKIDFQKELQENNQAIGIIVGSTILGAFLCLGLVFSL